MTPVLGSFADIEVIKRYSLEADLIINAGDSDAIDVVRAILSALHERSDGRRGKFVHVSGAANFLDGAREGVFKRGKVWDVSLISINKDRMNINPITGRI